MSSAQMIGTQFADAVASSSDRGGARPRDFLPWRDDELHQQQLRSRIRPVEPGAVFHLLHQPVAAEELATLPTETGTNSASIDSTRAVIGPRLTSRRPPAYVHG